MNRSMRDVPVGKTNFECCIVRACKPYSFVRCFCQRSGECKEDAEDDGEDEKRCYCFSVHWE